MYRADAARSGYTPDKLPDAIALAWTYRAVHPPMPAWPASDRMTFDRAFQPVIAGATVYFGSSADGKVTALDAATGTVRWTHFTDAPVRFAPVVCQDRLFVAGDDGWLVCLAAADGKVRWRLRGGPKADMLLGNDRMISRWPARGGPVLVDGILYWAAGIWPSEGVLVYAVDPVAGKVLWCNDSSGTIEMGQPHSGALARSGVAAQGYLAAWQDSLLVPTGRAVPAIFDRGSGKLRSFPLQAYGQLGGADVTVFDGHVFNHGTLFPNEADVKPQRLGRQLAAHPASVLTATGSQLVARDRRNFWVAEEVVDRKGAKTARKVLRPPVWTAQLPRPADDALIAAGDKAVLGGPNRVYVVDLNSHQIVWTSEVEGTAWGLAAADGRLYASTNRGLIYCFQDAQLPVPPTTPPPLPTPPVEQRDIYSAAGEEILRLSGIQEGYCVDLGCGDGRLALELAKRTRLTIYAVDMDAAKVAALRQTLDAAGLYGTRVTVHHADPASLPYPKWFADLIVSGRSVAAGDVIVPRAAVDRFQRPWGGTACLGKPGDMRVSVRGPLEGAGDWTHQYADAANSLCSADTQVKGPLAALWFRDTDLVMPNRHGRGPAPLVSQGRMFVEGLDALRAVSIYNGRTLWEHPLPAILRPYHQDHLMGVAGTGSNFCMAGSRIYVAMGDHCLCLAAEDGAKLGEWPAPLQPDGKPGKWGLIACEGNTLLGSLANEQHLVRYRYFKADMDKQFTESVLLFAMDGHSGSVKWTYTPQDSIRHNAVAIGNGRVYLIDRPLAPMDDIHFSPDKVAAASLPPEKAGAASPPRQGAPERPAAQPPRPPEHRPGRLVALDAASGKTLWTTDKDIFGTLLALSAKHDVLLMSYQPSRFQLDSERGGRMAAYRASDGTPLWDVAAKYIARPILNDRTIYAEPGAWDLLSGRQLPFQLARSFGCGIVAASAEMLVFRSATLGYIDLTGAGRTENYGGIRPGCWVNAIPAGGLVLMADAASSCVCSYLNQATIALTTREE